MIIFIGHLSGGTEEYLDVFWRNHFYVHRMVELQKLKSMCFQARQRSLVL